MSPELMNMITSGFLLATSGLLFKTVIQTFINSTDIKFIKKHLDI